MEKKNNILIIIIVILSILVGGLGSFIIFDKFLNEDSCTVDDSLNNKDVLEKKDFYGTYVFEYNENADEIIRNNKESTLTLNKDNTFIFNYNMCAGMLDVKGSYEVKDNKIILSDLVSGYQDVVNGNLNGRTTLEFVIISENEIYLDLEYDLACTVVGKNYGTFVKKQ